MDLKPGEELCDKCKGVGAILKDIHTDSPSQNLCLKCFGRGKLDWIENIVGKSISVRLPITYHGDRPPSNPSLGWHFIDSNDNRMYVYNADNEWMETSYETQ